MSDRVKELIVDFKAKGWETVRPYERLFELRENPGELFAFLKLYMQTFKKNSTLFNDALHYIEKDQCRILIQKALEILQQKKNENAEAVIESTSLQFPDLLHDYLPLIFDLKPNESAYYAEYPWRGLKGEAITYFKDKLVDAATKLEDKQKLCRCLLETRNEEIIRFVLDYATGQKLFAGEGDNYILAYAERCGYTKQANTIVSYCPNELRHFVFEPAYILENKPLFAKQHPTWYLPVGGVPFAFGGIMQEEDQNPLFHIITLDPIPQGLNITRLNRLVLGVHVREMNVCGPMFYQHDANGNPLKIKTREDDDMEIFEDLPIAQTQVFLVSTPERWQWQDWAGANGRENLHRLGGEPTWIQNPEVLTCPVCKAKMDFLLQLDSELPDVEKGELMFGSGGLCYVFWCDKSKISGYVMQCT